MPTSKNQSTLAPSPVPDNRQPEDLVARAARQKAEYRATMAQINAESIRNRADKIAKANARAEADAEAWLCREYKLCWAAKARPEGIAGLQAVLDEFKTGDGGSVNQRYTLQAMQDRHDAAVLAKAEKAKNDPDLDDPGTEADLEGAEDE